MQTETAKLTTPQREPAKKTEKFYMKFIVTVQKLLNQIYIERGLGCQIKLKVSLQNLLKCKYILC